MVLETIAVILRFVSRRIGKVSWSRDDSLIIVSWVMTIAFDVTILGRPNQAVTAMEWTTNHCLDNRS